jgi:hypothetical protein
VNSIFMAGVAPPEVQRDGPGRGFMQIQFSHTGSDGTNGLKAIEAAGGVTFAQDPKTGEWPGHAGERDHGRFRRFRVVT